MTAPSPIIVDLARRAVITADGQGIRLSWTEFNLLADLLEAQGTVRTREQLFTAVLRRPYERGNRSLDQLVHQVRRKLPLEADGSPMIRSVPGIGYWMRAVPRQDVEADRWVT